MKAKSLSQIVGVSEVCDQNGDRVYKNNISCCIWSERLQGFLSEVWKIWDMSIDAWKKILGLITSKTQLNVS